MSTGKTIYQSVRSEANLFAAWRHLKKSALNSPKPEIRGEASEFEHRHHTHISRIRRQLRENRYLFQSVKGVLKDKDKRIKQGKDPRPIAIARMEDRVVQRAILQVLQPRRIVDPKDPNSKAELIYDPRLGKINAVNRSAFGVGGLLRPYGGTERAIKLIMEAMDQGARHYFQSDIKAFFTEIPTGSVTDFVRKETQDDQLAELFNQALQVELSNADELKTYSRLFPMDGRGVAQGGSLSAFAGNVLLFDFDHQLNQFDVTAVRYIDDIVIVSRTREELDNAVEFAKRELGKFRFSLYPPDKAKGKADEGLCADAFSFLGCTIQPKRCVPSKNSVASKKREFSALVHSSKQAIIKYLKGGKSLDPDLSHCRVLRRIGDQLYGWEKSFAFCTEDREFASLDGHVNKLVTDYTHCVQRWIGKADPDVAARVLGIPSAQEQYHKDNRKREKASNRRV